ncbi:baseplate J/gp47 family protein [Paenibacillus sp. 1P07SE]|uniref:baseplate J/gp47 family protein n=1 Tax=Paenibacillus sp. 1P07SE TaxID=3132209 RepID=UPI0039A74C36
MAETRDMETILQRMLDGVPDGIDKRQGSIIYDALAPAALEMAGLYGELEVNRRLSFAATASGEYLELRGKDYGLERKPATRALRRGVFLDNEGAPVAVPVGSRYASGGVTYAVQSQEPAGSYVLRSEVAGEAGNLPLGALLPLDYMPGLAVAEVTDVIMAGEEAESDEALRQRYYARVRTPSAGGSKADYLNWAMEVPGVGAARVFPLWDGPGTVKVVIVDTDKRPASEQTVEDTATHIERLRPIGASVTVVSATARAVPVSAVIVPAAGYAVSVIAAAFEQLLSEYLARSAFTIPWVSAAMIGTLLLQTPGVIDYSDLRVDGGTVNIPLDEDEIGVPGEVRLEVSP